MFLGLKVGEKVKEITGKRLAPVPCAVDAVALLYAKKFRLLPPRGAIGPRRAGGENAIFFPKKSKKIEFYGVFFRFTCNFAAE